MYCRFSRIFSPGILIFKGLSARRLYKSFGVKGLIRTLTETYDAFSNYLLYFPNFKMR
jgi:hypothetical protein